jgi:hypothetical protein
MDGLYTQLCARGGVSASEEIKRDADRLVQSVMRQRLLLNLTISSFPTHPHLRDPVGPIVSLLQAYLTMVPDIRYQQGERSIAVAWPMIYAACRSCRYGWYHPPSITGGRLVLDFHRSSRQPFTRILCDQFLADGDRRQAIPKSPREHRRTIGEEIIRECLIRLLPYS